MGNIFTRCVYFSTLEKKEVDLSQCIDSSRVILVSCVNHPMRRLLMVME
jgi:hypothetical protein